MATTWTITARRDKYNVNNEYVVLRNANKADVIGFTKANYTLGWKKYTATPNKEESK